LTHGDPDRPIEVVAALGSGAASLAVHNYGTPIDPTFLPLLFNPFARDEKQHSRSAGLGLGLYISERIVEAHGGKLTVESSEGVGTRFEVILPKRT
jgi:signal transduction histidine kinase